MTRPDVAASRGVALAAPTMETPSPTAGKSHSTGFRADVEGLRAVAVSLVLLYHAGLPVVTGGFVGVDIFFVISGFLITSLLISELDRTGKISLVRFYARRAKRLLPAVAVVLVTTVVLVRVFVPETRWREIGGDIVASALYVVNWRLADRSVDYLAEGSQPSPVQHFWSLAVEEQYYLIWPVLILLAAVVARMTQKRRAIALWAGLVLVILPSFAWSMFQTEQVPARAFFETTTRMWELGVGAAVALGAGLCARIPKVWAILLGWAGLVAIVASGVLFTVETRWPGHAAALPVLGTAAVIAAGFSAADRGPVALLGARPACWVGSLSYSLYLWHWPILVAGMAYFGDLSPSAGLVLVFLSIVPAWVTFRMIENPIRYSATVSRSSRLALSLGANFSVVGVVGGLALLLAVPVSPANPTPGGLVLGAAVLREEPRDDPAGGPVDAVNWMIPSPLEATADVPRAQEDECQQSTHSAEVIRCDYGDPEGEITVAVVGDSKITQWMAALIPLAEQNGWRLITYLKAACSFALVETVYDGSPYEQCRDWTGAVLERLTSDPPDYLLTSQGQGKGVDSGGGTSERAMVAGLRDIWATVTSRGTKVIVIANNSGPPHGLQVYECVATHPDNLSACAFDRAPSSAANAQHAAVRGLDDVEIVDLSDAICPTERCAPVIGNVLVYRQGSHITATYIETLIPRLAASLSEAGLSAAYQEGALR